MNKRGVSVLITSVLLVLFVISLFSVVAYFMRKSPEKIMQEGSETFEKMINCDEINLETDASKFFAKVKDNKLEYIFADDVTKIYLDEKELINSEKPTTIAIKFNGNDLEISYKDNGNIRLNRNPTEILYNNVISSSLLSNGVMNL